MNAGHSCEIPLPSISVRALILAAVCTVGGAYMLIVVLVACSAELENALDQTWVHWALGFDKANPRLHNRAGLLYLDGGELKTEKAVSEFRRATALNPRIPEYWRNLGRACFVASNIICADDAYGHSVELARFDPRTLNDAAVYYLATGNREMALPLFHRLLEISPSEAGSALNLCLHAADPESTWRSVVQDQSSEAVAFEFFRTLVEQGQDHDAVQIWPQFISSARFISLEGARPFLTALEMHRKYADLVRIWQDLSRNHAAGMPTSTDSGLVVNPSFEQAPSGLGLDWHIKQEQFLDSSIVSAESGHALLLDFTVPNNGEHESVFRFVPVEPNKEFVVRALVRSHEITSDSGPRLRVVDPDCMECTNAASIGFTGTENLHEVQLRFRTSLTTQMIRLSVWRPRSRVFPAEINGQFWITDVSIRPVQ